MITFPVLESMTPGVGYPVQGTNFSMADFLFSNSPKGIATQGAPSKVHLKPSSSPSPLIMTTSTVFAVLFHY
jgi:hypothetical protein